jgi:RNA recognition motif-containing protein
MAKRLFVGGLPYATTEPELTDLFSQYGTLVSVKIITDKYSGRSKGFGFVEYEKEEEAQKAIEALNGSELGGRKIVVNEAKPMEERPSDGGRRFDHRGGDDRRGFSRN